MTGWKPLPALAGPLFGKDPWPLRFYTFDFGAHCWNTLACSLVFCGREFGTRKHESGQHFDHPSGPRPNMDHWHGSSRFVGFYDPIPGVEAEWVALDGSPHRVTVDLETIFKDRLILHRVPKEEIPADWLPTCAIDPISPSLLVEVDDRTINVYMNAAVVTCDPNDPSDMKKRKTRRDLMLAWTHTY
jgi:hypothetical protein